jgi:hypothetical protein
MSDQYFGALGQRAFRLPLILNELPRKAFLEILGISCEFILNSLSNISAGALGWTFLYALEDVPIRATEKAIGGWYKGLCDVVNQVNSDFSIKYDYRWCPDSVELRRIALRHVEKVKDRIALFDRILNAKLYLENQRRPEIAEQKQLPPAAPSNDFCAVGDLIDNIQAKRSFRS